MGENILTPRMQLLLESLVRKTGAGAIPWKTTDQPHTVAYAAESASILLAGDPANDPPLFEIKVLDQEGVVVDCYQKEGVRSSLGALFRQAYEVATTVIEDTRVMDALLLEVEAAKPSR